MTNPVRHFAEVMREQFNFLTYCLELDDFYGDMSVDEMEKRSRSTKGRRG